MPVRITATKYESSKMQSVNAAIVRGVPESIIEQGQRIDDDHEPINKQLMLEQKATYNGTLEKLGLKLLKIEADDALPDCVFTEDAAVVIGNKAVVTRLGHPNRRGEHVEMRKLFDSLDLKVFDMNTLPQDATIDGGDVLYTGQELYVGLSERSNQAGADFLAKVFQVPTHTIKVGATLHLKSNTSLLRPGHILISDDEPGHSIMTQMKKKTSIDYTYVIVPDTKASNVVYLKHEQNGEMNESVLVPANLPKSLEIIKKFSDGLDIYELDNSELSKVDGCLTCCSVPLRI